MSDADLLVDRVRLLRLSQVPEVGGWTHMGAVICNAGLQPRTKYKTVVLPRVEHLRTTWHEATTTSAFRTRLTQDSLSTVLNWHRPRKLAVIEGITTALETTGIETVAELRQHYLDAELAPTLISRLREVRGVGPKTVNYLAILAGTEQHVAIDVHLRQFARDAGITGVSDVHLNGVYIEAAKHLGWMPGELDQAVWWHQSEEADRQRM